MNHVVNEHDHVKILKLEYSKMLVKIFDMCL